MTQISKIKEIFETVDVDIESEHANSGQYLGGILIFKKNEHSKKYLEYVSNIFHTKWRTQRGRPEAAPLFGVKI